MQHLDADGAVMGKRPAGTRPADSSRKPHYRVRVARRMADVGPQEWDRCAAHGNVFVTHAYLSALEDSRSVGPETGYAPCHFVIEEPDGTVAAVAPAYVKEHSEGEYGTDKGWDRHHADFPGAYYPKLQFEVPLTPIGGPRLLTGPDTDKATLLKILFAAASGFAERNTLSSVHVNYASKAEVEALEQLGAIADPDIQLLWSNDGYDSFDAFVRTLRAKRRNTILRERAEITGQGIAFDHVTGGSLEAGHMDRFYPFYRSTNRRYGAKLLLRPEFFHDLRARLADRLHLILARRGADHVGGTLLVRDGDTLYARYWGCSEEIKFLHFEAVYYQAIDYAIRHGIAHIHGGSGGPHKISRGFLPMAVQHAHWFRDKRFHRLIEQGLKTKTKTIARQTDAIMRRAPFVRATPRA